MKEKQQNLQKSGYNRILVINGSVNGTIMMIGNLKLKYTRKILR